MSYNIDNLHSTLDYAIAYTKKGFSIIPLHKKSKRPSIYKWEPFRQAHASKEQLENWFSAEFADNNIGIITGKISSIFAIDIDGDNSDRQLIDANENTMKIITGSGNINIVFGFNPQDFSQDELRNLILWRDNYNSVENSLEKDDTNHKHSEIRLKGEGA
jgi:hypothetical protein